MDPRQYYSYGEATPLDRGLAAGLRAYRNTNDPRKTTPSSSVEQAIERTAKQQQGLEAASTSQALGSPTGTSASAYDYLFNRGLYPSTPVLNGQPVSMPYEMANKVGSPTQSGTSQTAASSPSAMPSVSYSAPEVKQPSKLTQAVTTLGPLALAYKYLMPDDAKKWVAGMLGKEVAANTALPAYSGIATSSPVYMGSVSGVPITTEAGVSAGAYDTAGFEGITSSDIGAAQATAAEQGINWSEMASTYGPYVAAAIILDQATGGHLTKDVGKVISNVGKGVGDVVSGFGRTVGNTAQGAFNEVKGWFGLADGGITGSGGLDLHIPLNFNNQGIGSTGGLGGASSSTSVSANNAGIGVGGSNYPFGSDFSNMQGYGPKGPPVFSADYIRTMQSVRGMPTPNYASGGLSDAGYNLGGYSDGGRLLRGPGDGVSDSIPAMIGNKQPARLADGEFVVPARIVSELGNGSTEAGARKLYAMMNRIQAGRKKSVGKGKVAVNSRADKHLPA